MNDIIKLPIKRNQDGTPMTDHQKRFSDKGYTPNWDYMNSFIASLPYGDQL